MFTHAINLFELFIALVCSPLLAKWSISRFMILKNFSVSFTAFEKFSLPCFFDKQITPKIMKIRTCRGSSTSNSTKLPIYRRKSSENVQTPIITRLHSKIITTLRLSNNSSSRIFTTTRCSSSLTMEISSDRPRTRASKTTWTWLRTSSSAMHLRFRHTRKFDWL